MGFPSSFRPRMTWLTDKSSCTVPRVPYWVEFPQGKKVCINILNWENIDETDGEIVTDKCLLFDNSSKSSIGRPNLLRSWNVELPIPKSDSSLTVRPSLFPIQAMYQTHSPPLFSLPRSSSSAQHCPFGRPKSSRRKCL